MKIPAVTLILVLMSAVQVLASDLVTPKLSEPSITDRFFDPDRFLTTAGIKYKAAPALTLEPELGVGYYTREQEMHQGIEQSTHRLHAQAGWRLSIAETFYLSAAAKLSMVAFESVGEYGGEDLGTRPAPAARQEYSLGNLSRAQPRWTGEVGIRLMPRADLMLYYDQNPLDGWSFTDQHQEERIGTRFIIRFQ